MAENRNLHQDVFPNSYEALQRCAVAVGLGWDVVFVGVDPDMSDPANTASQPYQHGHGPAGVTWMVWISSPLGPDDAREVLDAEAGQ